MWPFTSAWTEILGDLSLLGAVTAGARMAFCHQHGCYRLGRFQHAHYRLCHVHHPSVPSDGKIRAEQIAQVSVPPGESRRPSPSARATGGADNKPKEGT